MGEMKNLTEDYKEYNAMILSARGSVEKKELIESSSEEFNLDDEFEESMSRPKVEEKKTDVSKNGGYRDYQLLAQIKPGLEKMMYKTHDQSMFRGKVLKHAITFASKQKEGPNRLPVNHLSGRIEHSQSQVLGEIFNIDLNLQIALRTPLKEYELQEDATQIANLGLSCLQSRNKLEEDPIEYENIKEKKILFLVFENLDSCDSENFHSPIGAKNTTHIKFNMPNLASLKPNLQAQQQIDLNLDKADFSKSFVADTKVLADIGARLLEVTNEYHERQRKIHNSQNFREIMPRILLNRQKDKSSTNSPNYRTSDRGKAIQSSRNPEVQVSPISSFIDVRSSGIVSSQSTLSKNDKVEQFSSFFNKLHNRSDLPRSTIETSIVTKEESVLMESCIDTPDEYSSGKLTKKKLIELINSPQITARQLGGKNNSISSQQKPNSAKAQGMLTNLAILMTNLKTDDKSLRNPIEKSPLTNSLVFPNKGMNQKYAPENSQSIANINTDNQKYKSINLQDHFLDSDKASICSGKKQSFSNLLQNLNRGFDKE